jgi:co-chaperonin GroES (HSP10)
MEASGVEISRKTPDFLPDGVHLRLLRDHILVRPLDWCPSAHIAIAGGSRKPLRGLVIAVGPGARRKRYKVNARGERVRVSEVNGRPIPCEVKVGDVVELGGLEIGGYSFPEVHIGLERHLIAQEADVCLIVE